jgi:hypothetical protein
LLRDFAKGKHQRGHRREGKVIEEREGAMAHRQRQISPVMPADVRRSDEGFRRLEMVFARGSKGVEGGVQGAFIGGLGVGKGARVWLGRGDGRWRSRRALAGLLLGEGEAPDVRAMAVSETGGRLHTPSG